MRVCAVACVVLCAGCLDLDELGHLHDFGLDANVGDIGVADGGGSGLTWTRSSTGLPASEVRSVAYFPGAAGGTYWAATTTGGVYKSIGDTAHWTYSSSGLAARAINLVAVDGSGVPYISPNDEGVWKSNDGGVTWVQAGALPSVSSGTVSALLASGTGADAVVYAADNGGVYISTDAATTWSILGDGPTDMGTTPTDVFSLLLEKSVLYAGCADGVHEWTGSRWTDLLVSTTSYNVYALAATGTRLFASSSSNVDQLYTTPLPLTAVPLWTPMPLGAAAMTTNGVRSLASDAAGVVYAGSPKDALFVLGTTTQKLIAPSYLTQIDSLLDVPAHVVAPNNPIPDTVLCANINGVAASSDGGLTWPAQDTGLNNSQVYAMAQDPSSPTVVFAGMATNGLLYRTENSGATWAAVNSGLNTAGAIYAIAVDPTTVSRVYTGTANGMYASTNRGLSWAAVGTVGTPPTGVVTAIAIDPKANNTVYAGTTAGMFKSTDGAGSWQALLDQSAPISAVTSLLTTSDALYVAGTVNKATTVLRSTDGGTTWTSTTGLSSMPIVSLALGSAVDTVYAATGGDGVFKTTNGIAWHAANSGLGTTDVRAIGTRATAADILYIATSGGVYQSSNGAVSWHAVNDGLNNFDVRAIAVAPNGFVLAGTFGNGVYAGN